MRGSASWIVLAAVENVAGITALGLGLVARFAGRPFDTPSRLWVFLVLLGIAALVGVGASAVALAAPIAAASLWLKITWLVGPFVTTMIVFVWAAGFPLSRLFVRRG